MRKLLIQQSLLTRKNMPVSYHKYTVRLAEHMIAVQVRKNGGAI